MEWRRLWHQLIWDKTLHSSISISFTLKLERKLIRILMEGSIFYYYNLPNGFSHELKSFSKFKFKTLAWMAILNENEKEKCSLQLPASENNVGLNILYMLKFMGTTNSVYRHKILPLIAWNTNTYRINVECWKYKKCNSSDSNRRCFFEKSAECMCHGDSLRLCIVYMCEHWTWLEVSGYWLPENQNQWYYSKNQNSVQSDT